MSDVKFIGIFNDCKEENLSKIFYYNCLKISLFAF